MTVKVIDAVFLLFFVFCQLRQTEHRTPDRTLSYLPICSKIIELYSIPFINFSDMGYRIKLLLLTATTFLEWIGTSYLVSPPQPTRLRANDDIPEYSSYTGFKNQVYHWRGQRIRYIAAGPKDSTCTVLLIHGLFVNADTWRQTLTKLGEAGYRTYALDLLGSGYSSKPIPDSLEAKLLNGENGRFHESVEMEPPVDQNSNSQLCTHSRKRCQSRLQQPMRENVVLGTRFGGRRIVKQLNLRHPLNSCYNFYTWADQINDFTNDVIFDGAAKKEDGSPKNTSLIGNSKGCIVALQAFLDKPEYYNGVCAIDPTYREQHEAEMKFKFVKQYLVRIVQSFIRNRGHGIYNFIVRRRGIINKLLHEPFYNHTVIDGELLAAIAEPLNLPHSSDIVFNELSYSTGPLFEQQLQDINDIPNNKRKTIWVMYGKNDPWIHPERVESLITTPFSENDTPVVNRVIAIDDAGHCPQVERPEEVGELLIEFLKTSKNPE
jgi:pimeloyl-ACP methyl ester carboxylesterase